MKIRSPFLIKTAANIAAQPFLWLSRSAEIVVVFEQPHTNMSEADCQRQYLYSLWHDHILLAVMRCARGGETLAKRRISALVSQHQDGSMLADFMRNFHIDAVRGSTSRGGAEALRKLISEAEGRSIFITPDGPRGPRRVLKQGIVFLASQTGIPIIPFACVCNRAWDLKGSWTNIIVPKPFSKIVAVGGTPISIPPDLGRESLDQFRQLVEREMTRVENKAQAILQGMPIPAENQEYNYRAA